MIEFMRDWIDFIVGLVGLWLTFNAYAKRGRRRTRRDRIRVLKLGPLEWTRIDRDDDQRS